MANEVIDNGTANGNSDLAWSGGDGYLLCKGTFDGATVVVVGITEADGVEIPFEKEATFRENRAVQFSFPSGTIRGKLSGVGTSTSVSLFAIPK